MKLSIVVPVYNQEENIRTCIESLQKQSGCEREIILVDDASTDQSLEIMSMYAKEDDSIRVIHLEQNVGTHVARKRGVEQATGQYIMFCDSDDFYEENACAVVSAELERNPVDMLHFGIKVDYEVRPSEEVCESRDDFLKPFCGQVEGDLIVASFEERKWRHNLCNKAFEASVCKKAFSKMNEKRIVYAEDLYAFFLISYYAHSYRGIDCVLYHYQYGNGISTDEQIRLEKFRGYCSQLEVGIGIKTFLNELDELEKYQSIYEMINEQLERDVLYFWIHRLKKSDILNGYQLMEQCMGNETFVSALAREYWNKEQEVLECLSIANLKKNKKQVRRIGIWYSSVQSEGEEAMGSKLVLMFERAGYEVVLLTDEKADKKDNLLSDDTKRDFIFSNAELNERTYTHRAKSWQQIGKKYDLDTVLYYESFEKSILWDILMLKELGCNIVVQTQHAFSDGFCCEPFWAALLPDVYALADAVVTSSKEDECFWNNFCPAYYIQNSTEDVAETDIIRKWNDVFEALEKAKPESSEKNVEQMMMKLLLNGIQKGFALYEEKISMLQGGKSGMNLAELYEKVMAQEEVLNRHEEVVNRHEEVVNRHEEVVNRHEEVLNRHEEVMNRHEEVINRHEEVVNRHEEVLNRHEEVMNRHEKVVNDDWEWLTKHEERIVVLENRGVAQKARKCMKRIKGENK